MKDFKDVAKEWGDACAAADWKRANKLHARVVAALRSILIEGGESIRGVVDLANANEMGVALMAGTFALRHDPARGEQALSRLASAHTRLSFDAELVLREWKKGTLTFAWEEKV